MIMPKLPHLASTVDGKPIQGKLSDFKGELRNLWRDGTPEKVKKEEPKKGQVKGMHNRTIPPLATKAEYVLLKDAVAVVGGHVSTLRDWINKGELKDVLRQGRNGGMRFLVNMQEVTEYIRQKRCVQADGSQTWEQKNRVKRREYSREYYHRHKKLKFIREGGEK